MLGLSTCRQSGWLDLQLYLTGMAAPTQLKDQQQHPDNAPAKPSPVPPGTSKHFVR